MIVIIFIFNYVVGVLRNLIKYTDTLHYTDEPDYTYYISQMVKAYPDS